MKDANAIGKIVAGLALVLAATGCSSVTMPLTETGVRETKPALHVVIWLHADGSMTGDWDSCKGTRGYDDIGPGVRSRIEDQDGRIVGSINIRNLDSNSLAQMLELEGDDGLSANEAKTILGEMARDRELCILYGSGEVDDAEYYSIEVSHRGAITYSKTEIQEQNWLVAVSLGDK